VKPRDKGPPPARIFPPRFPLRCWFPSHLVATIPSSVPKPRRDILPPPWGGSSPRCPPPGWTPWMAAGSSPGFSGKVDADPPSRCSPQLDNPLGAIPPDNFGTTGFLMPKSVPFPRGGRSSLQVSNPQAAPKTAQAPSPPLANICQCPRMRLETFFLTRLFVWCRMRLNISQSQSQFQKANFHHRHFYTVSQVLSLFLRIVICIQIDHNLDFEFFLFFLFTISNK